MSWHDRETELNATGFAESPIHPMMLMITITEAKRALGKESDYPPGRESP